MRLNAAATSAQQQIAAPCVLTPVASHLRPVAGARRAVPRRIHGALLAITSTARSDRRIVVRRPGGVGVDATSASTDPAGAPLRPPRRRPHRRVRMPITGIEPPTRPRGGINNGAENAVATFAIRQFR
jgi:hypothetical protein